MTHISETTRMGHVAHPMVNNIYLKKEFGSRLSSRKGHDVLVIEAQFPVDREDSADFQTCLNTLLNDLPTISAQAEAKIGRFDRVDIRYLH